MPLSLIFVLSFEVQVSLVVIAFRFFTLSCERLQNVQSSCYSVNPKPWKIPSQVGFAFFANQQVFRRNPRYFHVSQNFRSRKLELDLIQRNLNVSVKCKAWRHFNAFSYVMNNSTDHCTPPSNFHSNFIENFQLVGFLFTKLF